MGKVYSLAQRRHANRRPARPVHFTRSELNQLFSLYSRRVARGEWRDYAIDQRAGLAAFSVFRRTYERPVYTITKRMACPGPSIEYLVFRDDRRLARTACLDDALSIFDHKLKIIS